MKSLRDNVKAATVAAARRRYAVAALLTIAAGLASRRSDAVPAWVGDLLWATMVFFLLSALRPAITWRLRAAVTLAVSYLVEISQLYQADWINDLRRNTVVHLVLGSGFSWSDIAAYTAGTAVAVAVDRRLRRP